MWSSPWIRILVYLALFALLLWAVFVHEKGQKAAAAAQAGARSARMRGLARRLGFSFDPTEDENFHEQHLHEWFRHTYNFRRWACNTLSGTLELGGCRCPLVMGDYKYEESDGKHLKVVHTAYLLVDLPLTGVPRLLMETEGILDRVAEKFGAQDLDVGDRRFSERFKVQCAEPEFARVLVTPPLARFLGSGDPPRVEVLYNELLICQSNPYPGPWEPDDFPRWMEWTQRFYALWPVEKLPGVKERTDFPAAG